MNLVFFLLSLLMLSFSFLHAEKVNIINSTQDAVLIIDGKLYRSNSVYNLDLEPGSHHVKVQLNSEVIYEQIFNVLKDQTTTIDTNVLVVNEPLSASSVKPSETIDTSNVGKLSVVNNTPGAVVSVNGKSYDKNSVFNIELAAGTHHVQVVKGKEILFSDVVSVTKGSVNTIDTNYKSVIEPKLIRKKKLKEIKKLRGNTGIGFQISNISGWSLKRYFGPFALQLTGFVTDERSKPYYLNDYDDYDRDNDAYKANARLMLNISEKIGLGGLPVRAYIGVGYGIDTCDDSYGRDNIDYYLFDNPFTYVNIERSVKQAVFGVEFDTRVGSFALGLEYSTAVVTGTKVEAEYNYWNYGYALDDEPFEETENEFNFNFAYHYYF